MDTTTSLPPHTVDDTAVHTAIISAATSLDGYRRTNLYWTNLLLGFIWMLFHFTVVFFFTFQLKSLAMVGIFLGIWNLVSLLLDIPVGILQRYIAPKTLFRLGAISQLVAMGIFFNFLYNVLGIIQVATDTVGGVIWVGTIADISAYFFGNILNILLLLVAAICYGFTKEVNNITIISYIMSQANASEYNEIFARNNIYGGIWSLCGLLLSGILLSFAPTFAIAALSGIILIVMLFTQRFFDNATDTVHIADITEFHVSMKKPNIENIQETLLATIKKVDLHTVLESTKYIFLRPMQRDPNPIQIGTILKETREGFALIYRILSKKPLLITLYWTIFTVLTFGFWDTFASTFLIEYLDSVKSGWSYILLGCIAIPAFGLQETFGKLSTKIWVITVAGIWLALSGSALVCMWLFSIGTPSPVLIMLFALANSVGYAAGMSLGQGSFLDTYNRAYSETLGLKEIDANASAAPMQILQNLANVVGLVFGGALLALPGKYVTFFIAFGCVMIGVAAWTYLHRDEIEV